ncbi:hypothetical protein HK099_006852 [Clydaea vesicula]|uniref:Beta-lactamase-related domain-containing protein n=1 Tax=Clydaea vesicula TaxID=447962 RepID=A0AAD5TXX8_9FUNG|nr:hypothetical protein HK099_006852 [Clydaea vesicula]KAJ3387815.1 hypothetical protein HDU92_001767 [Lobulomyces angularis]
MLPKVGLIDHERLNAVIPTLYNLNYGAVSVATIQSSKVSFYNTFGLRKYSFFSKSPANTLTRFQAASISKPVTALAVLKLVENGVLDLDKNVNEYLANSGWTLTVSKENKFVDEKNITTIRQLLSHTAGTNASGFGGYNINLSIPSTIEVLRADKPVNSDAIKVTSKPGTFSYSGGGTTVVQFIMETVLEKPFPLIMKQLILDPLDMKNSSFETDRTKGDHLAYAHGYISDPFFLFYGGKNEYHLYPEKAAAGLWTTAEDLCKFGIAVMNSINGKPNAFLNEKLSKNFKTNHNFEKAVDEEGYRDIQKIGLGFFLENCEDELKFNISHGGGNMGFRCFLFLQPHKESGFCVMSNNESNRIGLLCNHLVNNLDLDTDNFKDSTPANNTYMNWLKDYLKNWKFVFKYWMGLY